MARSKALFFLLVSSILVGSTGCTLMENAQNRIIPQLNKLKLSAPKKTVTEERTVKISCGREKISDYEKEGWKIAAEEVKDTVCTWKTEKATRGCNLEKDKGCRITMPDEMGKQTIYKLERKKILD